MAESSSTSTQATTTAPSSILWGRTAMANARIAVEIFDGTGHFGMWQSELLDALF